MQHELLLCIDAGATSVKVSIGSIARGVIISRISEGSGNVKANGRRRAALRLATAVHEALEAVGMCRKTQFKRVRIGAAGLDSPQDCASFLPYLQQHGLLSAGGRCDVSNDADLLVLPHHRSRHCHIITLVAGTGTVCMAFKRGDNGDHSRAAVVGGFGWLIGDDGSGYAIGRQLILALLIANDLYTNSEHLSTQRDPLAKIYDDLLAQLQVTDCAQLIELLYARQQDDSQRKQLIAGLALLVCSAFDGHSDPASRTIAERIIGPAIAALVSDVVKTTTVSSTNPSTSACVLAGSLWKSKSFLTLFQRGLARASINFAEVLVLEDRVAEAGVKAMLEQYALSADGAGES